MEKTVLLSIIESRRHPDFSGLYERMGFEHRWVTSMRKALAEVKRTPPDYVIAEFYYGYGNNYAGVNISNLDVMLYSLQKYSPNTKVIVLVDKSEFQYAGKLNEIIKLKDILQYPVDRELLTKAITC